MKNLDNYFRITCLSGLIISLSACGTGTSSKSQNQNEQLNNILNSFLQEQSENGGFTAISATVQCGNENPVSAFVGSKESNEFVPLDKNSLFQIGSITKSFTAVVLVELAHDPAKNFNLTDKLGKWFTEPEYVQWNNVTIIQLLNMSSGIYNYTQSLPIVQTAYEEPYNYISPEVLVNSAESQPLAFTPGTQYSYTNTAYILAGLLIEKITGNTPDNEIQTRIINKLNLQNTYFIPNLPESVIPINEMVHGYQTNEGLPSPYTFMNGSFDTTWWQLAWGWTAGAIISTPNDINNYIHALFTPGSLLTQDEYNDLTTNLITTQEPFLNIIQVSESYPSAFGLGIKNGYTPTQAGNYYTYTGETLGFSFNYEYYPSLDMSIVFSINSHQSALMESSLIENLYHYTVNTQCGKNIPYYPVQQY